MKWLLSLDRLVEADVLVLDLFLTLQGGESHKTGKGLSILPESVFLQRLRRPFGLASTSTVPLQLRLILSTLQDGRFLSALSHI